MAEYNRDEVPAGGKTKIPEGTAMSGNERNSKEMLTALAKARASMYRFLGGLYIMEVDADQMMKLKKMTFPEITGTSDADQDLRDGYALLREYLAAFPENDGVAATADAGTNAGPATQAGKNAGQTVESGKGAKAASEAGKNAGSASTVVSGSGKAISAAEEFLGENAAAILGSAGAEVIGKTGAPADKSEFETKLDDLAADFAKVFLAAGDATGRAAFPYESVYVDRRHRVGGSTEMQMHALYLERGLKADPDTYRTMDDNIGLMLEYQGNVCEELAAALETADAEKAKAILKEQKDFVKKHLTNWVYSFTADIVKYSERDFYKGVAKITNGFIKKEAELLKKGAAAWDIE